MKDKKVISCEYNGIKINTLVKNRNNDQVGLCLELLMMPRHLGEGCNESYDPAAVVLIKGRRSVLPVECLEIFEE